MKIIIINTEKYRSILERLMELENYLKSIHPGISGIIEKKKRVSVNSEEVYIEGEKVCELLRISKRTLLRMRKNNQITNRRVSHRCYYQLSEVEKLFAHRSISFGNEIRKHLKLECERLKEQEL